MFAHLFAKFAKMFARLSQLFVKFAQLIVRLIWLVVRLVCLEQGFSHPLPAGKKMPAEPPKNARQALKENVCL